MEMFTATMLEVFPPDCCDYRAVDMGHPCFSLTEVTCLAPAGGVGVADSSIQHSFPLNDRNKLQHTGWNKHIAHQAVGSARMDGDAV